MANIDPVHIQLNLSEELKAAFEEAKEAVSEDRIRAIVREEIEAYEKRQRQALRFGHGLRAETK